MNTPSHDTYKDIEDFFASPPSVNEKAWGLIHDFYHLVLTYMEEEGISKADLAKRLGKSRSAITQMFKKTPNITVKKMVEIADAIGLDIQIHSPQVHAPHLQASFPSVYQISVQEEIPVRDVDMNDMFSLNHPIAWTFHQKARMKNTM